MAHSHPHDHDHSHHESSAPQHHLAFLVATSFNFLFVIAEAVYALMANSMSLLADAGHNLSDVFGLALAWVANWLLTKPSTERYSYGYKKTTILASLSNALLLVFATGIIIYESVLRLLHPTHVTESIIMIVAGVGILINGGTALLFITKSKDDLNIKSAFLHLASDALLSLGVVITGAVVLYTHWLWLDPLVGILIAVAILVGTWGLMRDSVNLILAAVPRHIPQEKVHKYLSTIPGVTAVHDLHIWGLSTREVALTAHLIMPDKALSDEDFHEINDYLKHHFKINHATIQVERGHLENPCGQAGKC
jgi:cobalt-zinc-cadmium efflux system protein